MKDSLKEGDQQRGGSVDVLKDKNGIDQVFLQNPRGASVRVNYISY